MISVICAESSKSLLFPKERQRHSCSPSSVVTLSHCMFFLLMPFRPSTVCASSEMISKIDHSWNLISHHYNGHCLWLTCCTLLIHPSFLETAKTDSYSDCELLSSSSVLCPAHPLFLSGTPGTWAALMTAFQIWLKSIMMISDHFSNFLWSFGIVILQRTYRLAMPANPLPGFLFSHPDHTGYRKTQRSYQLKQPIPLTHGLESVF